MFWIYKVKRWTQNQQRTVLQNYLMKITFVFSLCRRSDAACNVPWGMIGFLVICDCPRTCSQTPWPSPIPNLSPPCPLKIHCTKFFQISVSLQIHNMFSSRLPNAVIYPFKVWKSDIIHWDTFRLLIKTVCMKCDSMFCSGIEVIIENEPPLNPCAIGLICTNKFKSRNQTPQG